MIINKNISALNPFRQLGVNNSAAQKSMEKLSSSLRINRAGDDAAGLAISEKMRAQVRGLDQAARNAHDAISMIQNKLLKEQLLLSMKCYSVHENCLFKRRMEH